MIYSKNLFEKKIFIIEIVLIILSIAASISKIYIGMDIDEAYITTMGIRMLKGDVMFRDMWELHQTSSVPVYIILVLLQKISGSLNWAVLTLRTISVLFSALIAVVFYFIMKKYYANCILVSLFIFNFLPRGTQNFEYGYLTCMFSLLSSLLLFYLIQESSHLKSVKVFILACFSGMFASVGWICYPTMCLTVLPVFIFLVLKKYRNLRVLGGYITGCIILFGYFFTYIFRHISVASFFSTLPNILSDGSHKSQFAFPTLFARFLSIKYDQVFLLTFLGLITILIYRMIFKKWIHFIYVFLLIGSFVIIVFNITGLRPSGVFGLQIRLLIITIAGCLIFYKGKELVLFSIMYVPGIIMLVGALLGSNLGVDENCGFLFLSLIAVLLWSCDQLSKQDNDCFTKYFTGFCVTMFVLSIIFIRGYIVRATGTEPANILEPRIYVSNGPLHGIYISEADYVKDQDRIYLLSKYVKNGESMLSLSSNALDNVYPNIKITTPSCISTPKYNAQWINYFQDPAHEKPSLLLLNIETIGNIETFWQSNEFGQYLSSRKPLLYETRGCYYLYQLTR